MLRGARHFRDVPVGDIPVSVTISMQIGPVATNASSIQPACKPFALASKGLPYRDVMYHAGNESLSLEVTISNLKAKSNL